MDELKDYNDYINGQSYFRGVKRRDFFRMMGGGLFVFFHASSALNLLAADAEQYRQLPDDFNAFLHIHEDSHLQRHISLLIFHQKLEHSKPLNWQFYHFEYYPWFD